MGRPLWWVAEDIWGTKQRYSGVNMRYLFFVLCLVLGESALAQTSNPAPLPATSCGVEQQKQFNFWLGDWDALYEGPGKVQLKASNHVTRELDGCVVEENFLDDAAAK